MSFIIPCFTCKVLPAQEVTGEINCKIVTFLEDFTFSNFAGESLLKFYQIYAVH